MLSIIRATRYAVRLLLGLGALVTFGALGCDDPLRSLLPPSDTGSMMVLLVLDPDSTLQPILIEPVSPLLGWDQLRIEFFLDGELANSVLVPEERTSDERYPCIGKYGPLFGYNGRCAVLAMAPSHGQRYSLVLSATGRPTATADGVIPGDFEIISVAAEGDPPGTEGLEVHWTASEGAWRYAVGVRPDSISGCSYTGHIDECTRTWFAATADTVLRVKVPQDAVAGGHGPWWVDVFAMERGLYEHLTTGTAGDYFSVPPVQNVRGGYGAVGAWVVRTAEINR
jgi:hypothetical protein